MPHKPAPSIADTVEHHLQRYFADLDGATPCGVYDMVMRQAELPLLRCVMAQCNGNQSQAAQVLGLNRNTLRKKLLEHDLID